MNGFVVELPAELQAEVARRAGQKPGGESAWVADAVREKLEAMLRWSTWKLAHRGAAVRLMTGCCPRCPPAPPLPGDERGI